MNPERIAKEAREAVGRFCLSECQAYCCRKGSISCDKAEMEFLAGPATGTLISTHVIVKLGEDKYQYKLTYEGCPKLEGGRCTVHGDSHRPKVCGEFPVFIKGRKVTLASSCFAVRTNILYPYIKRFREKGLEVTL